jgi:hypothetical protein
MCCEKPLKAKDIRIESVELNDAGDLNIQLKGGSAIVVSYPLKIPTEKSMQSAAKVIDGDLKLFVDSHQRE